MKVVNIKKIIIDKDQLWIIHKVLDSLTKTPVGKYAILTNKAIILQRGCVLSIYQKLTINMAIYVN